MPLKLRPGVARATPGRGKDAAYVVAGRSLVDLLASGQGYRGASGQGYRGANGQGYRGSSGQGYRVASGQGYRGASGQGYRGSLEHSNVS